MQQRPVLVVVGEHGGRTARPPYGCGCGGRRLLGGRHGDLLAVRPGCAGHVHEPFGTSAAQALQRPGGDDRGKAPVSDGEQVRRRFGTDLPLVEHQGVRPRRRVPGDHQDLGPGAAQQGDGGLRAPVGRHQDRRRAQLRPHACRCHAGGRAVAVHEQGQAVVSELYGEAFDGGVDGGTERERGQRHQDQLTGPRPQSAGRDVGRVAELLYGGQDAFAGGLRDARVGDVVDDERDGGTRHACQSRDVRAGGRSPGGWVHVVSCNSVASVPNPTGDFTNLLTRVNIVETPAHTCEQM